MFAVSALVLDTPPLWGRHNPRTGERASTGRYGCTWCTAQSCFANCRCELRLFPEESRSTSCGPKFTPLLLCPGIAACSLGVRCSCRMKKGSFLDILRFAGDYWVRTPLKSSEETPGCRKLRQQTRKVETLVSSSSLLVWFLSSKAAAVGCCEDMEITWVS